MSLCYSSTQRLYVTQLTLTLGIFSVDTNHMIGGKVAIIGIRFKQKVLHYSS